MPQTEFDVIIIGGGITGVGTARDCAMRGLRTLLVERGDIADGATGRNHGLLHSGARYAVKDAESAEECIRENKILRKIAAHCVEDTKGIFITLPEDCDSGYGLDYQAKFIEACHASGIDAIKLTPSQALEMEPAVNPAIIGAVQVPDGSVDPFRLCVANMLDAQIHGARVLRNHPFVDFVREGDTITGVKVLDKAEGTEKTFYAPVTVNAAGIWSCKVAEKAGIKINMFPAKGSLLIFGHRINNVVINRCRKSADGDILVPGDAVTVIGTTSSRVPIEECDDLSITPEEVQTLLREGSALCPALQTTRILRAYAGVRPLVASDDDPTGRSISRGIVCLDHEKRDNVKGLVTITGGKLMTYRLMAETVTNLVCSKLAMNARCETAEVPMAGSKYDTKSANPVRKVWNKPAMGQKAAFGRQGILAGKIDYKDPAESELVCECEHVTMGEVHYAVQELGVRTLSDLRRRTRLGMGTCQGTYCIKKAAKVLAKALGNPDLEEELMQEYLSERWKGMTYVGWGDTLREMELMQKVYKEGVEL